MPPDRAAERQRALAFLRTLDEQRAERREHLDDAVVVFADSLPLVHDQNKAIATREMTTDEMFQAIFESRGQR